MKKLLGTLAVAALATSAFAQGTVVFANNTGLVQQWTSATDQTLISVPKAGGSVQLIAAPKSTPLANPFGSLGANGFAANYSTIGAFITANPGWASAATASILPIVAGSFNGGIVAIPGVAVGTQADYFMVGWTGAFASYDLAYASGSSFFGASSVFTTGTGDPTTTPPGTPTPLKNTFTGLILAPMAGGAVTPEPSTFALAGLGAAALMIFRRRK